MIQKGNFRAMGSTITVILDSDKPSDGPVVIRQIRHWFDEWEDMFSRFRPDSELNRLNRSSGSPFRTSAELMDVLILAHTMREWTDGLVTPTVLDALKFSGYNVDFTHLATDAIHSWLNSSPPVPESLDFELDTSTNEVTLPRGVHLDLGGFAKGWCAHQAIKRLRSSFPVLVNAGGDIACSGSQMNGDGWLVGIEKPYSPQEYTSLIHLTGGGLATSSTEYRRWMKEGTLQHHLIDPRTGLPAVTRIISASVAASSVMQAEAAAKAALIAGSTQAVRWLDEQKDLAYLLQMDDGTLITNPIFESLQARNHDSILL